MTDRQLGKQWVSSSRQLGIASGSTTAGHCIVELVGHGHRHSARPRHPLSRRSGWAPNHARADRADCAPCRRGSRMGLDARQAWTREQKRRPKCASVLATPSDASIEDGGFSHHHPREGLYDRVDMRSAIDLRIRRSLAARRSRCPGRTRVHGPRATLLSSSRAFPLRRSQQDPRDKADQHADAKTLMTGCPRDEAPKGRASSRTRRRGARSV